MRLGVRTLLLCLGWLTVAACQREAEPSRTAPEPAEASIGPIVLQTSMTDVVKPQTEVVLNILIAALTEPPDPQVDASRLSDTEWEIMEAAATALRDEAIGLRDRPIQVLAAPGDRLQNEQFPGSATGPIVQAWIDANPAGFSEHAEELRMKADEWLGAIRARDGVSAWRIALEVDPVCVECHEVFWSGEPEHEDDHDDQH